MCFLIWSNSPFDITLCRGQYIPASYALSGPDLLSVWKPIQKKVEHIPRFFSLYVTHWGGAFGWGTSLQVGRSRFRWGHWHNLSGRTMALGSTLLPTEINTGDTCWCKGGRCLGLTTLPTSCVDCPEILYKRLCYAVVTGYSYKNFCLSK